MESKPLDSTTSLQIKYCRILCIFFMCMVHVPPGLDLIDNPPLYLDAIETVIGDVFGRASVAALSFISGFLIVYNFIANDWLTTIRKRFVALVVPMAFWNLAIIVVGLMILKVTGASTSVVEKLEGLELYEIVLFRIFTVDYGGATESLNFLRDIFMCVVLSPVIIWLAKRLSWLLIPALLIVDSFISFQPLVMRGMILVFFSFGVVYSLKFDSLSQVNKLKIPALIGSLIVIALEFAFKYTELSSSQLYFYEIFKRVSIGTLAILCAYFLANTVKSGFIHSVDRSTYFLFLAHNVFFLVCWGAWQLLFSQSIEFPYVFFYLSLTAVWFVIGFYLRTILNFFPRPIQQLVTGKAYRNRS